MPRGRTTPQQATGVRLSDYHAKMRPVVELFRVRRLLAEVDGVRPPDDVQRDIRRELRLPDPPCRRVIEYVP